MRLLTGRYQILPVQNPASGKFSAKVKCIELKDFELCADDYILAIEYITGLKREYDLTVNDNYNLKAENEQARQALSEYRNIENELTMMWEHMNRLEPNARHVFGTKTQQLDERLSQGGSRLAPLPPPSQSASQGSWPSHQDSAMQGVTYGNGWDRR